MFELCLKFETGVKFFKFGLEAFNPVSCPVDPVKYFQNIFKIFSKYFQNFSKYFQNFSKYFQNFSKYFQNFSKYFQNIFKGTVKLLTQFKVTLAPFILNVYIAIGPICNGTL